MAMISRELGIDSILPFNTLEAVTDDFSESDLLLTHDYVPDDALEWM
jgi:hypothetical protein